MTDQEVLEQRLDMFQHDGWRELMNEYTKLAESLEKIYDIEDEKTQQKIRRASGRHRVEGSGEEPCGRPAVG